MQDKLVSLLPHGNFTDSFSVGVLTRDKLASTDLTAYNVSANINVISYDIEHINPPPFVFPSYISSRLLGSSLNQRNVKCRHPYKTNAWDPSCT